MSSGFGQTFIHSKLKQWPNSAQNSCVNFWHLFFTQKIKIQIQKTLIYFFLLRENGIIIIIHICSTARAPSVMGTKCCVDAYYVVYSLFLHSVLLFYTKKKKIIYFFFASLIQWCKTISCWDLHEWIETEIRLSQTLHQCVICFRSMKSKFRFIFMHRFFVCSACAYTHEIKTSNICGPLVAVTFFFLSLFLSFYLCPNDCQPNRKCPILHSKRMLKMLRWIVIVHRPFRHMRMKKKKIDYFYKF